MSDNYVIELNSRQCPPSSGWINETEWQWVLYCNGEWAGSSPFMKASKQWVYEQAEEVIKERREKEGQPCTTP